MYSLLSRFTIKNYSTNLCAGKRFTSTLNPTPASQDLEFLKLSYSSSGKVGIVQLNRPKSLNALSSGLFHELNKTMDQLDNNTNIGAIVLTGGFKAFAAGADIKEMASTKFVENYKSNFLNHWTKITTIRKPIIAAVQGFALGGGCELAMMCDIIYAADTAKFGQPEIKIGTIPGAGGTQRLVKAIGKSKAMELLLTGQFYPATDAHHDGLVAKIYPADQVVDKAVQLGDAIAKMSALNVQMIKELVNASHDMHLQQGLLFERRLFQSTFGTLDQQEGMLAFAEKRDPMFTHS